MVGRERVTRKLLKVIFKEREITCEHHAFPFHHYCVLSHNRKRRDPSSCRRGERGVSSTCLPAGMGEGRRPTHACAGFQPRPHRGAALEEPAGPIPRRRALQPLAKEAKQRLARAWSLRAASRRPPPPRPLYKMVPALGPARPTRFPLAALPSQAWAAPRARPASPRHASRPRPQSDRPAPRPAAARPRSPRLTWPGPRVTSRPLQQRPG